jgi:hypothetical protein
MARTCVEIGLRDRPRERGGRVVPGHRGAAWAWAPNSF